MKKVLVTMAMLLTVGVIAAPAGPNHRHHHTVQKVDKDTTSQAIEAYSDTTAWDDAAAYADDVDDDDAQSNGNSVIVTPVDEMESLLKTLCGFGGFGIFVCVMFLLAILIVVVVPLVIVFLIVRYLMRQHGQQPNNILRGCAPNRNVAKSNAGPADYTASHMWQRGVHNLAVGVGLMLFFFFLGATPLVGIGALVACMGAGKMYIGRYSRQGNRDMADRTDAAECDGGFVRGDSSHEDNDRYADPDDASCGAHGQSEKETKDNMADNADVK